MHISYPKLILDPHIASQLREVVGGVASKEIPSSWKGIIIYHPATNQYYSTKSKEPLVYEEVIRTKPTGKWDKIALALRKLFNTDGTFQFFVMHVSIRPVVEQWLASQGKVRVTTKMGDAAEVMHVMFKVTSPFNKVSRFVVAPANEPREDLIAKANSGMALWLKSHSSNMRSERNTLQIALRSRMQVNNRVFEKESEVIATNLLNGYTHNQFRSHTRLLNELAVKEFVRLTMS